METSLLNHFFMQSWGVTVVALFYQAGEDQILRKHLLISEPLTEGLQTGRKENPHSISNSPEVKCVAQL